jgi:uncharacterized protein (TIGR02466 family)
MTDENNKNVVSEERYFSSAIYSIEVPQFLDTTRKVTKEYLLKTKKEVDMNKIYPVVMSENFQDDERMQPLVDFIKKTSIDILYSQGYNMDIFDIICHEFWAQEHHQYSGQEEHIHPNCQISGFYFLDVPKETTRVVFHDNNQAKKMLALPEANMNNATFASTMINYVPKPGLMMFSNSWLPHSFLKNPSKKTFTFIHFNLVVSFKQNMPLTCAAEVV